MRKAKKKISFWKREMDKHFWFSLMKSVLRILACYLLWRYQIPQAAVYFAMAEILGIAEEF